MKKSLESWKLWTILSALIFVMTFWLVVYAATTVSRDFTQWKTGNMWNTLTSTDWNNLMDSLNSWTVPAGAIMAFNSTSCPEWWQRYSKADWKFLMWANAGFWEVWWTSSITLTLGQIPQHQHRLFSNQANGDKVSSSYGGYISYSSDRKNWNQDYDLTKGGGISTTTVGLSSYQLNSKSQPDKVDITNPFVKVIYCVKQ